MTDRAYSVPAFLLSSVFAFSCVSAVAQSRVQSAHTLEHLRYGPAGAISGCGIRAVFELPNEELYFDFVASSTAKGAAIVLKVYTPITVGPPINDIWLQTASYSSLKLLEPAQDYSGLRQVRGVLDHATYNALVQEFMAKGANLDIFLEGTLPASRLPLKIDGPIPGGVQSAFTECLSMLFAK